MAFKFTFRWCIWLGLVAAVFAWLYLISPLGNSNVMWAAFVALPIYFLAGANRKDLLSFLLCDVLSVGWGVVFLSSITLITGLGVDAFWSTITVVGFLTFLCCVIHLSIPDKYLINKVPMLFGGIACTFSQGGKNLIPLVLTLIIGTLVALIMKEGTNLLNEDGSFRRKQVEPISQ